MSNILLHATFFLILLIKSCLFVDVFFYKGRNIHINNYT